MPDHIRSVAVFCGARPGVDPAHMAAARALGARLAAAGITLYAHFNGAAYVQSLPQNEAQKRIARAHFAAGIEGYPLRFTMEPET